MIHPAALGEHAQALGLEWDREQVPGVGVGQALPVRRVDDVGVDDGEVVAAHIVELAPTQRHVREVATVTARVVRPETPEKELEKLLLCNSIRK